MSRTDSGERRKTRRIRHRVATRAKGPEGTCDGVITNLSEVGLLAQLPKPFKPGSRVALETATHPVIRLDGRVIWTGGAGADETWLSGMTVSSPPAEWLSLVYGLKSRENELSRRASDDRFEVQHNVRLDGPGTSGSRTENLSFGGMYLAMAEPLEHGSLLRAQIEIPGLPEPLKITGRVVYRLASEEAALKGRKPGVGVQFVEMETESRTLLRHYLKRLTVHRQKRDRRTGQLPATYGSLAEYLVPEILWSLHEAGFTGHLRLERDAVVKTVYFNRGNPVYVESTERTEAFGQFLLSRGRIDSPALESALADAKTHDLRLGEALLRRGLLDGASLTDLLVAHQEEKLTNCFPWFDGNYVFAPKLDWPEGICLLPLRTARIVVSGVVRWYDPEMVGAWMGLTVETRVSRAPKAAIPPDRPSSAAQILQLASSPRAIAELAQRTHLPVADHYPLVFVLILIGSLQLEPPSARIEAVPPPPPEPPKKAPIPQEVSALMDRIRREAPRLAAMNFYELLGMRAVTSYPELERAFVKAAEPYVGGTLEKIPDPELREKGSGILASLRLAYDVLRDPSLRQIYARHGGKTSPKEDRGKRIEAERQLLRGIREMREGNFPAAVKTLATAEKAFPEDGSIPGYLGWALFQSGRKENLKTACELLDRSLAKERMDSQLWYYRGTLYMHLRNWGQAERCFDKALRLNPCYAEAITAARANREEKRREEELLEQTPHR